MDRISVSNKSVAKVYVNSLPPNPGQSKADPAQGSVGDVSDKSTANQFKFYFSIGSIELFEKKLDDAQQALGIDPHNYVPVIYESEANGYGEILSFAIALLLTAGIVFMKGGSGVGGSFMKGGQGLFSFGKAKITKLDKFSKNKVSIV